MALQNGVSRPSGMGQPQTGFNPALKAQFMGKAALSAKNPYQHRILPLKVLFGSQASGQSPLLTLEETLKTGKLGAVNPVISSEEKSRLLAQVEQEGFLRMPPQEALDKLVNDPPFVLELVKAAARARGVLAPGQGFPVQAPSPVQGKNKVWFSKTHHHVLNIANLTAANSDKKQGDVWKAVIYLLTRPEGSYHLMPWHEKDLNSNYTPNNPFRMDPGIESKLLNDAGITGTNQLRLLADVGKLTGKTFWYDVLPHSAHFGAPVMAHPENFTWVQFDLEKLNKLPRQQSPHGDQVEIYKYEDLRHQINNGASPQDIENYVFHRLKENGIVKHFPWENQQAIIDQVKATVKKHLNTNTPSAEDITPEQRQAITMDLIGQGLWTMPRHGYNAWNHYPMVRGYNLTYNYPLYQVIDRGDKGNGNGQMFPFTRFAFKTQDGKLREGAIKDFISQAEFADKLGLADAIRLDQVDWLNRDDHVFDPLPGEALRRMIARFPEKPFVAERLDAMDKEPYRTIGANAIVGDDWRKEIKDPFYFERSWDDQSGTLKYAAETGSYITSIHAFENHDQHMQPPYGNKGVSPFDPARGGFYAGKGRFLTMLFLNGSEGSSKPFYDIMGDEVGLEGQQVYKGGFTPGAVIDLSDKKNFYPTYVNALTLRYGSPKLKKVQEALNANNTEALKQMDTHTLYAAKAQSILQNGYKTWHSWYSHSGTVVWKIEAFNGKGYVIAAANPHWSGSRGNEDAMIPKEHTGSGKGVELLLDDPNGIKTKPLQSQNDIKIEQLRPSEVRLFYFDK